ncbi:hypothetical protein CYMTET_46099 [Cymbomonas tetramitiformis]|uniref:TPM domain-containing protein n=1 Tax=Cymbomonas tetramitiformis TaxID=36881 RepID=A0AAE0EXD9_9CHLO|nr:hypothetical protein CYMTET_46099 [Cymbomonas tetramitiformis]
MAGVITLASSTCWSCAPAIASEGLVLPEDGGTSLVLDFDNVFSKTQKQRLASKIEQLEADKDIRVRVVTRVGSEVPSDKSLAQYWKADSRTIVVFEDATSPNILSFAFTDETKAILSRDFFRELQEVAFTCRAWTSTSELTVWPTLAGGLLAGYGLRSGVAGFLSIPIFIFVWALGLQPITSRTDELLPLAQNLGLFAFALAATYLTPIFGQVALPTLDVPSKKSPPQEGERKSDAGQLKENDEGQS